MPDRNSPNWTPDETFWNEGWADMDRQLSKKRRRPYVLFFLLLLGCVGVAGTLVLYSPEGPKVAAIDPPEHATEQPVRSPRQAIANDDSARLDDAKATGSPRPVTASTYREEETDGSTETTTRRLYPVTSPAPAPRAPLDERKEGEHKAYVANTPVSVNPLKTSLLPLPEWIPLLELRPVLPTEDSTAEGDDFTAKAGRSLWAVSLGTNAYVSSVLPGGFAGVEYQRSWEKWFVPVSLRYDYGRRQLKFSDDFALESALPLFSNGGNISGFNSNTFRSQVESSSLNRVETHALELRTGAGYRFSGRISVSGGAGVSYLLSGSGPAITGYVDSTYYGLSVRQDPFSYNSPQADRAGAGSGRPANTSVYRWGANGWLNIDYRVGQKWAAGLGITHHLTPLYQDEVLDSERTRFEIRITKAW